MYSRYQFNVRRCALSISPHVSVAVSFLSLLCALCGVWGERSGGTLRESDKLSILSLFALLGERAGKTAASESTNDNTVHTLHHQTATT